MSVVVRDAVRDELARFNYQPLPTQTQDGEKGFPYALDNPWNFRFTTSPKRLPGKAYSTIQLRAWADDYDVLRSILEYLKSEVAAIPIKVIVKEGFDPADVESQILEANEWIGDNGPVGGDATRRVFESKIMDDALIVGSYAVWYEKDRRGRVISCHAVDSSTIKPCVDALGWPDREKPFEQWVMGAWVASFKPGEIRLDGMFPNTRLPYFTSPVEWAVRAILAGINVDKWNDSWLTEPSVKNSDVVTMPETWTPEQIQKFAEFYRLQGQSMGERQALRFLPNGAEVVGSFSRKDQDFAGFEMQVVRRLCGIFGVQPASIGYVGEQYKVTQGDSMDASRRVGLARLLSLRKEFYDDLLRRLGFDMLEVVDVEDDTDRMAKHTDIAVKACGGAFKTINEVRAENGLAPVEGGDVIPGVSSEPEEPEEIESMPDSEEQDIPEIDQD